MECKTIKCVLVLAHSHVLFDIMYSDKYMVRNKRWAFTKIVKDRGGAGQRRQRLMFGRELTLAEFIFRKNKLKIN